MGQQLETMLLIFRQERPFGKVQETNSFLVVACPLKPLLKSKTMIKTLVVQGSIAVLLLLLFGTDETVAAPPVAASQVAPPAAAPVAIGGVQTIETAAEPLAVCQTFEVLADEN